MSLVETRAIEQIKKLGMKTGKNLLKMLVDLYIESTPQIIESMKRNLENKSYEDLGREAHSLKSSSANLGISSIRIIAEKIELLIVNKQIQYEQINEDINLIEEQYLPIRSKLLELI